MSFMKTSSLSSRAPSLTPEQRLRQVAAILARGVTRWPKVEKFQNPAGRVGETGEPGLAKRKSIAQTGGKSVDTPIRAGTF